MKDKNFYSRVYEIVAEIPVGKVTTYGSIAKCLGSAISARMVGFAMNAAMGVPELPCHRVVNRLGELTGKRFFPTPTAMRELLESEGVTFVEDSVAMEKHFWQPCEIRIDREN